MKWPIIKLHEQTGVWQLVDQINTKLTKVIHRLMMRGQPRDRIKTKKPMKNQIIFLRHRMIVLTKTAYFVYLAYYLQSSCFQPSFLRARKMVLMLAKKIIVMRIHHRYQVQVIYRIPTLCKKAQHLPARPRRLSIKVVARIFKRFNVRLSTIFQQNLINARKKTAQWIIFT